MPQVVGITLNTAPLDRLIGEIPNRAQAVLDKIAFDVERVAKPLTNLDTGAMRSSIYVSGASGGSAYSGAAAEALSRRPGVRLMGEIMPQGQFERVVGVAVEYAYWQELQKPYLEPAVDQIKPQAEAAWKALFDGV